MRLSEDKKISQILQQKQKPAQDDGPDDHHLTNSYDPEVINQSSINQSWSSGQKLRIDFWVWSTKENAEKVPAFICAAILNLKMDFLRTDFREGSYNFFFFQFFKKKMLQPF